MNVVPRARKVISINYFSKRMFALIDGLARKALRSGKRSPLINKCNILHVVQNMRFVGVKTWRPTTSISHNKLFIIKDLIGMS
jgi:hypothetical protein